jgi:Fe-S cluster assembly scaffold protein SufB
MPVSSSIKKAKYSYEAVSGAYVSKALSSKEVRTFFHVVEGKQTTVNLHLGQGSKCHYILLVRDGETVLRSSLEKGASVHWHVFSFETGTHTLDSELNGERSTSQVNWVFRAGKKEKQTIGIKNIFSAKNGGGEIVLKGVAEDHAQVACNGMIQIGLNGGGTKTHLTEDVLMLDATAKVDAIPGLEIKTNDVKASHSATVSRVTPEQLFYLQSRGLPEEVARKLFIDGFLGELIETVPENMREKVREMIV